jgi:hypothetical protein
VLARDRVDRDGGVQVARQGLEARREVRRVPDRAPDQAVRGAEAPDEGRAGGDADPGTQPCCVWIPSRTP